MYTPDVPLINFEKMFGSVKMPNVTSKIKSNTIENNTIKDLRNRFRLKKEKMQLKAE